MRRWNMLIDDSSVRFIQIIVLGLELSNIHSSRHGAAASIATINVQLVTDKMEHDARYG